MWKKCRWDGRDIMLQPIDYPYKRRTEKGRGVFTSNPFFSLLILVINNHHLNPRTGVQIQGEDTRNLGVLNLPFLVSFPCTWRG
jgi:hypothetical protein